VNGADEIPRRRRPGPVRRRRACSQLGSSSSDVSEHDPDRSSRCDAGAEVGSGGALRKTMRFRGTLSVSKVSLRCFPFDLQVLPVRLKAARCRRFLPAIDDGAAALPCPRSDIDRVSLVDSRSMMKEASYRSAETRHRGCGHYAVPTAGDALLEFDICSVTGCHPDAERGDVYEITILVERPLVASYICDLFIMNLLVGLAACAFWDTAAPELSSRMSISLTVILTLAAYTSTRPAPIEKAPYVTFHDWCEQMCMFLVTGISIQNVVAVVMCGGHHEEAPPYMAEMFERHREQCSVGWCLSRKIDCQSVIVLLATWVCLTAYSVIWLVHMRHRMTVGLRNRLSQGRAQRWGDEGCPCADQSYDEDASMTWACSDSLDSSDSFGSWTHRFFRCMTRFSGSGQNRSGVRSTLRCMFCTSLGLVRRFAKCFRRTSSEVCTASCASPQAQPHYSQALDNSPVAESCDHGTPSPCVVGAGLRGRPRPLDMCATFGSGCGSGCGNASAASRTSLPGFYCSSSSSRSLSPTSPTGSQPRTRTRGCPSTPNSGAGGTHPLPSPASSTKSSAREAPVLGRSNYSHLND